MATWADDMDPMALGDDFGANQLTQEEAKALADREAAWKSAKVVTEIVTDAENKQYEVVKRVLQYRVDREATPVDVRAKWRRFGKAANPSDEKDLVSRDPPIVLELGEVDPFERMARDEVMRLMNEVERYSVEVKNPELARYAKVKEEQDRAAKEAASPEDQGKERTWAAARGDRTSIQHREDTERRLRVTNISDDISRDELYNIFNTDEYRIEKLYLPTDKETSNYRGFAFITFETAEQAERCLARTKGTARFKNTVMCIVRAQPEGSKQRN